MTEENLLPRPIVRLVTKKSAAADMILISPAHADTISIEISDMPPFTGNLDNTIIERTINKIKDEFARGDRPCTSDDFHLNANLLCTSYLFVYRPEDSCLEIQLLPNRASKLCLIDAKELIEKLTNSKPSPEQLETMRQLLAKFAYKQLNENLFLRPKPIEEGDRRHLITLFAEICVERLQNVVDNIYNDALVHDTTPNYYQFGVGTDANRFL